MRYFITTLLAIIVLMPMQARKNTTKSAEIYVFGVAQSFTDSVVYLSSVQRLDGATLTKDGLLNDRVVYSQSYGQFIQTTYGQENSMGSLMFATSKKKAENLYLRVRSRYMNRLHAKVREIQASEFQFKARTYDYNQ